MIEEIITSLVVGFLSSIAWFLVGGLLYMNPYVAKIYKKHSRFPGVKKWPNNKKYLLNMYLFGILAQCVLFAFVYIFLKPIFVGTILSKTFFFGLLIVAIKIIPRFFDMWLQSTYPNKLLQIELINGIIGSFVIAFVLVFAL